MRRSLFVVIALFFVSGCSKPTFVWKSEAKNYLLMYQKMMFEGDSFQADYYYRDALKEARKSPDVKPIAMIYLTSCAMYQALFKPSECRNYKKIKPLVDDAKLNAYEAFILGESLDSHHVEKYASVIEALQAKDQNEVNESIAALESVYSKAIASAVALKYSMVDEKLIDHMIHEASRESMKGLMQVWLQQKLAFYKQKGDKEAYERLALEMTFIMH